MVNLEWYRTFKAIYQNGTLTKAAQELMISQPNVSIQLASLESYIGSPLFLRLPRKMVPTEQGKILYTQVVESIDNLERVESYFKKSVLSKIPNISLGTPAELFSSYMVSQLAELENLHLDVRYGLADQLIDLLANNELDIAFITQKNELHDHITFEPLVTETFMVVCNNDLDTHEFENYANARDLEHIEAWFKNKMWVVYSSNLVLVRRFWRENFQKRPLLKLRAVIPDNNAILMAVANSHNLAVSSDLIAGKALKEGLLKILWKGISPATNVLYLAYNKNRVNPKYIDEIRSFCIRCINL